MFNKKVIVLCGRAQSGKSTAAKLVEFMQIQHTKTTRMAFADPIKDMLWTMGEDLGLEPRHLWGTNEDKNEVLEVLGWKSARHAMQTLGSEWRDLMSKTLWVRHLHMRIDHVSAECVIVDDMRFEHEYQMMKDQGAIIIGIERPDEGTSNSTHQSETWDFKATGMPVIMNDGTVEELREKLALYL